MLADYTKRRKAVVTKKEMVEVLEEIIEKMPSNIMVVAFDEDMEDFKDVATYGTVNTTMMLGLVFTVITKIAAESNTLGEQWEDREDQNLN